jgi:hypothetical protein
MQDYTYEQNKTSKELLSNLDQGLTLTQDQKEQLKTDAESIVKKYLSMRANHNRENNFSPEPFLKQLNIDDCKKIISELVDRQQVITALIIHYKHLDNNKKIAQLAKYLSIINQLLTNEQQYIAKEQIDDELHTYFMDKMKCLKKIIAPQQPTSIKHNPHPTKKFKKYNQDTTVTVNNESIPYKTKPIALFILLIVGGVITKLLTGNKAFEQEHTGTGTLSNQGYELTPGEVTCKPCSSESFDITCYNNNVLIKPELLTLVDKATDKEVNTTTKGPAISIPPDVEIDPSSEFGISISGYPFLFTLPPDFIPDAIIKHTYVNESPQTPSSVKLIIQPSVPSSMAITMTVNTSKPCGHVALKLPKGTEWFYFSASCSNTQNKDCIAMVDGKGWVKLDEPKEANRINYYQLLITSSYTPEQCSTQTESHIAARSSNCIPIEGKNPCLSTKNTCLAAGGGTVFINPKPGFFMNSENGTGGGYVTQQPPQSKTGL